MKFKEFFCRVLQSVPLLAAQCLANTVVAHVIVGNNWAYTVDNWKSDMQLAAAASIDGFVLNVATPRSTIATQVSNAFQAAGSFSPPFKLFFSFDYLGGSGPWPASDVIDMLNTYSTQSVYYKHSSGKPIVSTFEGTSNTADWDTIRSSVPGGIFFIPDWTSLGPTGITSQLSLIDGCFSWDMWPSGAADKTEDSDIAWKNAITGKPYMMGVSPWFYTDLLQYNKQWTWRGDDLWHYRWQQVNDINPDIVQIATWNDFGESHYIGPLFSQGFPDNTARYANNMPHDHWRDLLPHYIETYKNGGVQPTPPNDKIVLWHRLTPKAAGSTDGVTGIENIQDRVFVTALTTAASTISIQIGNGPVGSYTASGSGVWHFNQDFAGYTGNVTVQIQRGGTAVLAYVGERAIVAQPPDGIANWNAWVGGAST